MGLSVDAASLSLDAFYGDDAAAIMPASFTVRLYIGDPRDTGVELTDTDSPGYVALTGVTNNTTNFPNATSGEKTTATFSVCTADDVWDAAPTWAALCDGTDVLEAVELTDSEIPTAGAVVTVQFVLFYDDITG